MKSWPDNVVIKFTNCRILINHELREENLFVRNGKIINPQKLFFDEKRTADVTIDCRKGIIAPGYIDIQLNGMFAWEIFIAYSTWALL